LGSIFDTMPAGYPEVETISAYADSDGLPGGLGSAVGGYADDTFSDFSNFSNSGANGVSWYATNNPVTNPHGLGIDLALPGVGIYSTYKNGGYTTMSGLFPLVQ
jgi:subtilisin